MNYENLLFPARNSILVRCLSLILVLAVSLMSGQIYLFEGLDLSKEGRPAHNPIPLTTQALSVPGNYFPYQEPHSHLTARLFNRTAALFDPVLQFRFRTLYLRKADHVLLYMQRTKRPRYALSNHFLKPIRSALEQIPWVEPAQRGLEMALIGASIGQVKDLFGSLMNLPWKEETLAEIQQTYFHMALLHQEVEDLVAQTAKWSSWLEWESVAVWINAAKAFVLTLYPVVARVLYRMMMTLFLAHMSWSAFDHDRKTYHHGLAAQFA